jgi:hypothetical protein
MKLSSLGAVTAFVAFKLIQCHKNGCKCCCTSSCSSGNNAVKEGRVDAVVGSQWGDEGKGKLVDIISKDYDICARVAGGSNAGHTIVVKVSFLPFFQLFFDIYFTFVLPSGKEIQIPFNSLRYLTSWCSLCHW